MKAEQHRDYYRQEARSALRNVPIDAFICLSSAAMAATGLVLIFKEKNPLGLMAVAAGVGISREHGRETVNDIHRVVSSHARAEIYEQKIIDQHQLTS